VSPSVCATSLVPSVEPRVDIRPRSQVLQRLDFTLQLALWRAKARPYLSKHHVLRPDSELYFFAGAQFFERRRARPCSHQL
jgi:hypothetical protein